MAYEEIITSSKPASPGGSDLSLVSTGEKDIWNNKVNKSEISSGENNTTSVINVTDAKAQMAMVTNIKGKTLKNMFSGYTDLSGYTVSSEKYNGHDCITSTSAWSGARDTNLTLVTGKKYCIRAMVKVSVANTNVQLYGGSATIKMFTIPSANTWTLLEYIGGVTSSSTTNIRFEATTAVTTTISEFVVAESETSVPYIPPATLASVPVESLVSIGKNIADNYPKTPFSTISSMYYYNVSPNTKYTISYVKSRVPGVTITNNTAWTCHSITFYDNDEVITLIFAGQISGNGAPNFPSGSINDIKLSITTPSNCNRIGINYGNNNSDTNSNTMVSNVQIERGEVKTAYEPYNKTTAVVPQDIRNLPDYGCSLGELVNEVDFENGVYYHRVGSKMLKDLNCIVITWNNNPVIQCDNAISDIKAPASDNDVVHAMLAGKCVASNHTTARASADGVFSCTSDKHIYIRDNTVTTSTDLATYTANKSIVYERTSVETIPLTDYIRPLPVENGGTLTLINEHNLDVNSTIKYKKEVN